MRSRVQRQQERFSKLEGGQSAVRESVEENEEQTQKIAG